MKKISVAIFVFSLLILFVSATILLITDKTIKTEILYTSVNITDRIGFDVNGSALIFGNIINGGSSTRNIIFKNDNDIPVVAKLSARGNIRDLLEFEDSVIVYGNETVKIPVTVYSKETNWGFYDGEVELNVKPV